MRCQMSLCQLISQEGPLALLRRLSDGWRKPERSSSEVLRDDRRQLLYAAVSLARHGGTEACSTELAFLSKAFGQPGNPIRMTVIDLQKEPLG